LASVFSFDEKVVACDLCGGTRLAIVSSDAKVVECRACGYRFVAPRPSQAEIASSYSEPDFYDNWLEDEAGRKRMWSKRLDLLRRAGPAARVLDIGAGIGSFLFLARERFGWKVTGTEVSTAAVRIARERYALDLLLGSADDLALTPGSFDLITLWHVLEHVPSPSQTLKLCHELLAPNGLLAIAVPNDDDARAWLVRTKASLRRKEPPPRYEALKPHGEVHLSQFKSKVLKRALESRGFRVEVVTVDDQYARPDKRSERLIRAYRSIQSVTRLNFGQATFVLARKDAAATAPHLLPAQASPSSAQNSRLRSFLK
jgi:2-polyprenyl-3-methyl-5-hydroxy-6-metoxy-1,4-benzoquinol methylase